MLGGWQYAAGMAVLTVGVAGYRRPRGRSRVDGRTVVATAVRPDDPTPAAQVPSMTVRILEIDAVKRCASLTEA
jgi:hypothetical protein